MPDPNTHFICPGCNRFVLKGSSFCRVCGLEFKPGDKKPCALCLEFKDLKHSHAIPNSFFKELTKGSDGKKGLQAIVVTGDSDTYAKRTNESWWTEQLCLDCEQRINQKYEKYCLAHLRGQRGRKIRHDGGITFKEFDLEKLQLFSLSIFWRAANSEHPSYSRVFIPEPWNDELRKHILDERPVPLGLATVKVSHLKDKRKNGIITDKALTEIIMTPFHRLLNNRISFFFIMEGFLVEISTLWRFRERQVRGVLNPKQNILVCPFIHPYDIPEFRHNIFVGMRKGFEDGASKKFNPPKQ